MEPCVGCGYDAGFGDCGLEQIGPARYGRLFVASHLTYLKCGVRERGRLQPSTFPSRIINEISAIGKVHFRFIVTNEYGPCSGAGPRQWHPELTHLSDDTMSSDAASPSSKMIRVGYL